MQTRQSPQQIKDTHQDLNTRIPEPQTASQRLTKLTPPAALIRRAAAAPRSLTRTGVSQLHRTIGNQAVGRLLGGESRVRVQTKLVVSQADDKYEQEADRVAKHVASPSSPSAKDEVQTQLATPHHIGEGGMPVSSRIEASIQQARGSGQAIPAPVRTPLEQTLGANFSGVRVHSGAHAHELNRSLSARAFTTGQDIFFRQGEYNPDSSAGREVLAHELTHVVQQRQTIASGMIQLKKGKKGEKKDDKSEEKKENPSEKSANPESKPAKSADDVMKELLAQEEEEKHKQKQEQGTKKHKQKQEQEAKKQKQELEQLKQLKQRFKKAGFPHVPDALLGVIDKSTKSTISKDNLPLVALDKLYEIRPDLAEHARYADLWEQILGKKFIKPSDITLLCEPHDLDFDILLKFMLTHFDEFKHSTVQILDKLALKFTTMQMSVICDKASLVPHLATLLTVVTGATHMPLTPLLDCVLRKNENVHYLNNHLHNFDNMAVVLNNAGFVTQLLGNDLLIECGTLTTHIVTSTAVGLYPILVPWLAGCQSNSRLTLLNNRIVDIDRALQAVIPIPHLAAVNFSIDRLDGILDHLQNNDALPAVAGDLDREISYAQVLGAHLRHILACPLGGDLTYLSNLAHAVDTLAGVEWGYEHGNFNNGAANVHFNQGVYVPIRVKEFTLTHHAIAHLFNPRNAGHRVTIRNIRQALGNFSGTEIRNGQYCDLFIGNNMVLVTPHNAATIITIYFT